MTLQHVTKSIGQRAVVNGANMQQQKYRFEKIV